MSKKSKRAARKRRVTAQPRVSVARPPTASAPAVQAAKKPAVPSPTAVDFSEEYRYVIADLKRIGVLAIAMMGLLVVLSFIIR
ncbi:MAG: hypothetical protein ACUVWZ_16205 [Anaerolineae bacterium]